MNQRVLGYLSWQRRRYRVHRREVLDALVEDLREQSPDHVAITGDLVNISLPAEFVQAARVAARSWAMPDWVTVIPGNHDAYVEVKWREAWAHWSDYMCGDGSAASDRRKRFPFLRRRGPVALIGMSTAVATPPTFATGRLGRPQLGARPPTGRAGSGRPLPGAAAAPSAGGDDDRLPAPPGRCRRSGRVLLRRPVELVLCGHQHIFQLGGLSSDGCRYPGRRRALGLAARRRPAS